MCLNHLANGLCAVLCAVFKPHTTLSFFVRRSAYSHISRSLSDIYDTVGFEPTPSQPVVAECSPKFYYVSNSLFLYKGVKAESFLTGFN